MTLYLKDADFLDWKTLKLQKTHLKVDDDLTLLDEMPQDVEALDCSNRLVTKSFVCGHHHAYSALARGMPIPDPPPKNFYEILDKIWWPLDRALDREMIEVSAMVTAIECALNGVTFVIDHHASPHACMGSLEIMAKAFDKVGISHLLCYELSDRDGLGQVGVEETRNFLSSGAQGLVGLHASFTVSDVLLEQAMALIIECNTGAHLHVAEDLWDQEHCKKAYGKRVIHRFRDMGILQSPKTILAHCLHLDDSERKAVAFSEAYVAQNTQSNQNNKVGVFDPRGLGPNIMLGTDGMHSNMIESAQAAYLAGNLTPRQAYERFRRAHLYLESNGFKGDGDNNLVILDYDPPTEINDSNFPGHFIYGLRSHHVESVIASGELVVKNRQVLNADAPREMARARELSKKLWRKL